MQHMKNILLKIQQKIQKNFSFQKQKSQYDQKNLKKYSKDFFQDHYLKQNKKQFFFEGKNSKQMFSQKNYIFKDPEQENFRKDLDELLKKKTISSKLQKEVDDVSNVVQKFHKFWFDSSFSNEENYNRWFHNKIDIQYLQDNFEKYLFEATKRTQKKNIDLYYEIFKQSNDHAVGVIVLFSQAPRILYKGDARSIAYDPISCHFTTNLVEFDKVSKIESQDQRILSLFPLIHSEVILDKYEAMDIVKEFIEKAKKLQQDVSKYKQFVKLCSIKADILIKFDRHPEYNQFLGRESNDQEIQYLKDPYKEYGKTIFD